jgi:hypothetical protein
MDLFLAGCQGLGLALAAGIFAGASGRRDAIGLALLIAAVVGGAALFGISLTEEDHPAWPGFLPGAVAAWVGFAISRDVAAGAAAREGAGTMAGVYIAVAALALAGLSILLPPVALVALVALGWLALARRQRADRKYEGLRTLR